MFACSSETVRTFTRRFVRGLFALTLAVALVPALATTDANAETVIEVNSTDDRPDYDTFDEGVCDTGQTVESGDLECTLRAAVETANADVKELGEYKIVVPAGHYVLSLGELVIDNPDVDITISGSGSGTGGTVIDAESGSRIINIKRSSAIVDLDRVRLVNGSHSVPAGGIGGAINNIGTLTVRRSVLADNETINAGGGGGAIRSMGSLRVEKTTFDNNQTAGDGGAIYMTSADALHVSSTTFSNNDASSEGGAIYASDLGNTMGDATIANSTFSGNSASFFTDGGHGILLAGVSYLSLDSVTMNNELFVDGDASVETVNTIFARGCAGEGSLTSLGHNLDFWGSCGPHHNSDILEADPDLEPLADNGGLTQTHALRSESPAIDAGSTELSEDQRGKERPFPFEGDDDIGAFESQVSSNFPPLADAGGPYTVDEGDTVDLDGSGSGDRDGSIVSYQWDFDGDEQFDDASGETATFDAADLDGPDSATVALRVTDDDGATATDSATVTIDNVAPAITADSGDQEATEGDTVDVEVSFEDPADADTHTASVDWGDGDSEPAAVDQEAMTASASHIYDTADTYTLEFSVTDDDGGSDSVTRTVTVSAPSSTIGVSNVPPEAVDDEATTVAGTAVEIDVLDNDTDADGHALRVLRIDNEPGDGDADIGDDDTTVTYTPDDGFVGEDSFIYELSDGHGGTDTATVTITVTEAPIIEVVAITDDDETLDVELVEDPDLRLSGWQILGVEVDIEAASSDGADAPITLTFRIDADAVPEGEDHATIQIFREGELVADCAGSDTADPDPCVSERRTEDGTVVLTVLTTATSSWQVGYPVSACPTQAVTAEGFADVPTGSEHEDRIDCAAWWNLTDGVGDGRYEPLGLVTRTQMATFLARLLDAAGVDLPDDAPDAFPDDDGFHEPAIDQLAAVGVVLGTEDGTYEPQGHVTRAQMAAFLVRTYEFATGEVLLDGFDAFSDDDDTFHEAAINAVAAAGIASGVDEQRYAPDALVRRQQMATFLVNVLDLLVADDHADPPIR